MTDSHEASPPDFTLVADHTFTSPHIDETGDVRWVEETIPAGTGVWRCNGATYGVLGPNERAVSLTGRNETPFRGVPRELLASCTSEADQ